MSAYVEKCRATVKQSYPAWASTRLAESLFSLTALELRQLVKEGLIPAPKDGVHGQERWDVASIDAALVNGAASSAKEQISDRIASLMREPATAMIYFARCQRYVKIGISINVEERMRQIAAHNPFRVTLWATIPGTLALEAALHEMFAVDRYRNEWFVNSERIWRFLRETDGVTLVLEE